MDGKCIFCGIELGLLNKKKLNCGNTMQTLCKDCYSQYKTLSAVERAEAALNTGRADSVDDLRTYLDNINHVKQEKEEERKRDNERRRTDLKCLRCDGYMLDYGPVTFKLGEETFFFSDWNRLMSGAVTMNIFRCEKCGKVEFFSFDDTEFDNKLGE